MANSFARVLKHLASLAAAVDTATVVDDIVLVGIVPDIAFAVSFVADDTPAVFFGYPPSKILRKFSE